MLQGGEAERALSAENAFGVGPHTLDEIQFAVKLREELNLDSGVFIGNLLKPFFLIGEIFVLAQTTCMAAVLLARSWFPIPAISSKTASKTAAEAIIFVSPQINLLRYLLTQDI